LFGSPQLAPYDLILWQAQVDAIMNDRAGIMVNYSQNPARERPKDGSSAAAAHYSGELQQAHDAPSALRRTGKEKMQTGFDANNKIRQAQAMMGAGRYPGPSSLDGTRGGRCQARVLIIVSKWDHVVTPGPRYCIRESHPLTIAGYWKVIGRHMAPAANLKKVNQAVADFLAH